MSLISAGEAPVVRAPGNHPTEPVAAFTQLCREAGLRLTHQRLEICAAIAAARNHPSAEELHERLRRRLPTVALDTVYRTLALLERHGFVTRLAGADGRSHFDGNPEPHHHLLCARCGRIQDISWPEFDALEPPPAARRWLGGAAARVTLRGLCPDCRRSESES